MSNGRGYAAHHLVHSDYSAEGQRVFGRWQGRGAAEHRAWAKRISRVRSRRAPSSTGSMRCGYGKLITVDADRRRKIVFLIGSMEGGGAARVFVTLLRHLDRNHFKPYLVLLRAEGELMCQVPKDVVVHTLHQSWHYPTLARSLPLMRNL